MSDTMDKQMAWEMLCNRLQRNPATSEESDTCSLRSAWKAMLAFKKPTQPQGWQPIESAPKDDAEILIWNGFGMYAAQWAYDDQWQPEGLPTMKPTHWMPLPEAPL